MYSWFLPERGEPVSVIAPLPIIFETGRDVFGESGGECGESIEVTDGTFWR